MDQQELEALLGRPLTDEEVTNLDLYLDIADERLEALLCSIFLNVGESGDEPQAVPTTRKYETREGYSTVFTDIFTEVTEVKVDGIVTTDFTQQQFDKLNAEWFNSLVFEKRFSRTQLVEVTGTFGFTELPADLALVLARLFDSVSNEQNTDSNVQSQRIDDAQVTFKSETLQDQFYQDNKRTLDKYSICSVGYIRHGKTWRNC